MNEIIRKKPVVSDPELTEILERSISNYRLGLKKVLLLPPDITRIHSEAGKITAMLYGMLKDILNHLKSQRRKHK